MKLRRGMFLFALLSSVTIALFPLAIQVQAQVTNGTINSVSFPNDFPTAKTYYPYVYYYYFLYGGNPSGTPYLLEGQAAPVNVSFEAIPTYGNASTGPVTIIASSAAFVEDVNSTVDMNTTYQFLTFSLNPIIQTGIDGTYSVDFRAVNELSMQVAETSTTITVWSTAHLQASDSIYSISAIMSNYYTSGLYYGSRYTSGEAKSNFTLATIEYSLAMLAYNNKDWNSTNSHAQNATELIREADAAETASSLPDKTAYFVQVITYPSLIIAILAIIYIAVATYRKIHPSTKTTKTTKTPQTL